MLNSIQNSKVKYKLMWNSSNAIHCNDALLFYGFQMSPHVKWDFSEAGEWLFWMSFWCHQQYKTFTATNEPSVIIVVTQTCTKNSFGLPTRVLQFLSGSTSFLIAISPSVPNTFPSSPWLRMAITKQSQSEWSLSESEQYNNCTGCGKKVSPKSFSLFSRQSFGVLIPNYTVLFPKEFYI